MNGDNLAVGVDLGGSHLAVGIVDSSGKIREVFDQAIDHLAPPETTLGLLAEQVKKISSRENKIKGVGIGLPGNHDSKRGVCRFSPNFPAWHNVEVTPFVSQRVGLPVYMLNDVRVAALGEFHFGAGREVKNMVMMAIGTGIGGGVVAHGELLLGCLEAAGEIGHMTIHPNGNHCNCGNRGCLEAYASGPAIAAQAASAIIRGVPTKMRGKITKLEEMNARVVAEAAHEQDPVAMRILEEAGQAIGIAIANLAVILNPDRFIIGGGVAQAGEPLFSAIHKEIAQRLYIISPESVNVVPAQLGVRAGLIGAAAYALLQSGRSALK